MDLLDTLENPGREFTPIPFWFLNDRLTHREIRAQLQDFRAHGVYGLVLHPRMGLPGRLEYLSPAFFSYIRTAVETARRLDMTIVFYDEGMYPSGSASGKVAEGHPELASRGLALVSQAGPADEVVAETPEGILVSRPSGGTMRGIHWGEDDGGPGARPSADILNPEAVSRFLALTHEAYWREFREYFGSTVMGFFTDEPSILGRNVKGMFPWTRGFREDFLAAGGHPAGLTALFREEENDDTRLYDRMIVERENTVYYAALSGWCQDHGIALMGHPDRSDDIERERHFHIPGQDLVYRQVSPEGGGITGQDSTQAKCSADAARLLGRRRNSNECLGCCFRDDNPWYLPGEDMKWYLDWLAVRGVNLFIPHAFYYSIRGKRSQERPPDVGPNSIWWPHYSQWALYMRRLSCLMTDADLLCGVAVLCHNRDLRPDLAAPLYESQRGFQYIPESFWKECSAADGRLTCRGRQYGAVLGPEDLFPEVPHDVRAVPPDLRCAVPQPDLRCARILRCGRQCWFLVNEGEADLDTPVSLDAVGRIGQYDLWTGAASRFSGTLRLPRRGSILLFICTEEEWGALPEEEEEVIPLPAPEFSLWLEEPARIRKIYRASLTATPELLAGRHAVLEVRAEEQAELSVNGVEVGVGFWSPQRFDILPFLREGENDLQLSVTGSPANRFGRPVPYGLLRK